MTEIINGIETRNRGGIIEHRHAGIYITGAITRSAEAWHPVDDISIINEMNKRHDENIITQSPTVYR